MNLILGAPFQISREYVYQFPAKEGYEKTKDVIFNDTALGQIYQGTGCYQIIAPARFSNSTRTGAIGVERITINYVNEQVSKPEVFVELFDSFQNLKRKMEFVVGEEVITAIPLDYALTKESDPCIPAAYRVKDIEFSVDFQEEEIYCIVEFENLVPVYDKITQATHYEVFSLSCYEVTASPYQFGMASQRLY